MGTPRQALLFEDAERLPSFETPFGRVIAVSFSRVGRYTFYVFRLDCCLVPSKMKEINGSLVSTILERRGFIRAHQAWLERAVKNSTPHLEKVRVFSLNPVSAGKALAMYDDREGWKFDSFPISKGCFSENDRFLFYKDV